MAIPNAYLRAGMRTPVGRYGGILAARWPDDLAARLFGELMARRPGLPLEVIDGVCMSCVNLASEDSRNVVRMATPLAGLPQWVLGATPKWLCGSGLDAILLEAAR